MIEKAVIDMKKSHFWDLSAVNSLDKIVLKFRREGTEVELLGLNEATATIVDKVLLHDKPNALELIHKH